MKTMRDALENLRDTEPHDISEDSDPAHELAQYRRFVRRTVTEALAAKPGELWVLVVISEQVPEDDDVTIHASKQAAIVYLSEQSREKWDEFEIEGEPPEDDEEAIDTFMDQVGWKYTITSAVVM